ncbi:MAG: hypothetical protein AAGF24_05280 [Cyanobacteria bacterium P01_H01_bin.121]
MQFSRKEPFGTSVVVNDVYIFFRFVNEMEAIAAVSHLPPDYASELFKIFMVFYEAHLVTIARKQVERETKPSLDALKSQLKNGSNSQDLAKRLQEIRDYEHAESYCRSQFTAVQFQALMQSYPAWRERVAGRLPVTSDAEWLDKQLIGENN